MGTRINVLLSHDLADHRDREVVLRRLSTTLVSALAVRKYWETTDPSNPHDQLTTWRAHPEAPSGSGLFRYTAPGSLFLTVTRQAAKIRTGGRWEGFVDIEALRRVHVAAFKSLALALGSQCMAFHADSCEVDDEFWKGE
jgi:hypothetical protein